MKKRVLGLLFCAGLLVARTDFSAMSNQELIALMGYVKAEEKVLFLRELEARKPTFSPQERKQYERNLRQNTSR